MPDLILLDPGLPDARGLEAIHQLRALAPEVPLVLLTGHDDEELATKALRAGAQDYVCKNNVDNRSLARALRHAMERHRVQSSLRTLALFDDLTGLYNHRGFRFLAEQHMKLIARSGGRILLVCIDLDGLKYINDHFGHQEVNRALAEAAEILKSCFRQSDVIGRLGGDEFAVLVTNAEESSAEIIRTRLLRKLKIVNSVAERLYELCLSVGILTADSSDTSLGNLAELLARADALMYEEKRKRHRSQGEDPPFNSPGSPASAVLLPSLPEAFRLTPCSRAGVRTVGCYQSCDRDAKVKDAKNRFGDRKGTCLR